MMRVSFSFGPRFLGMAIPLPVITLFIERRAYTSPAARGLLRPSDIGGFMKLVLTCAIAMLAMACMQKQADGTYKATTDTAVSDAAKKAHDDAVKEGQEIKKTGEEIGTSDAAQKIKNGSG